MAVPLASRGALARARPHLAALDPLVDLYAAHGIYAFYRESPTLIHARMFGGSDLGITEDPATGGAAGPLAGALVEYKLLPPEWTSAVYTQNAADVIDRPLVAELQLSEEREEQVRLLFKKPAEDPKILIVTDKLLTGYDAPALYCLYLDKPMRDHVLLQAIARVNRPYVDANGVQKRVGLVVDFVGVLRELKKALQFDSADVSGVIEDIDVLLQDFLQRIAKAEQDYLQVEAGTAPDERLEKLVFGRFLAPEARKSFFEA